MNNRWYDKTAEQTAEMFKCDIKKGLSDKDVIIREKKYGKNDIFSHNPYACRKYMRQASVNLPAYLLMLFYIIRALIEKNISLLMIPLILILSLLLVYPAYYKARKVLEMSVEGAIPLSKVLRNGKLCVIRQDLILPGDIIIINSGDIVPCDCRLIESNGLVVLEAFGKSGVSVIKDASFIFYGDIPPEKQKNMLFTTGIVTGGSGKAIAVGTGKMTDFVSSGKRVPLPDYDKISVLQKFIRLSVRMSLILVSSVFAFTLFSLIFNTKLGIINTFNLSLALCVSSICDFLPMLAIIIISCGIFSSGKIDKKSVQSAEFRKIEKLDVIKDINCLIFHKSSLFAGGNMVLSEVYGNGRHLPVGKSECADDIIVAAIVAKGMNGRTDGKKTTSGEDEAILKKAREDGIYNKKIDDKFRVVYRSSKQVYLGKNYEVTVFRTADGKNCVLAASSADTLLSLCKYESINGNDIEIDRKKRCEILSLCDTKIRNNYHTIAVASKTGVREDFSVPVDSLSDMTLEGILFIERPVIDGAARYISECRQAGIKTVMLCDEKSDRTDIELAKNLGIISDIREAVSLKELSVMSADMIRTNIPDYNLYRGLSPVQIKYVIETLKKDCSYSVGYCGVELSDTVPMASADISFAEYISPYGKNKNDSGDELPVFVSSNSETSRGGCEALRYVSDVTVKKPLKSGEGGYNSVVSAVISAKGIFRNLRVMCEYLCVSFSSHLALLLLSLITGNIYISAFQIVFSGCVIDLFAVIVIAFERPEREILIHGKTGKAKRTGFIKKYIWLILNITLPFILTPVFVLFLGLAEKSGLTAMPVNSVIFLSGLIMRAALVAELSIIGSIFGGKVRMYNIYPIFLIFTAAVAVLSVIFPEIGNVTGIVMPQGIGFAVIFIPALLVIVSFEIIKGIINKASKTKNK